MRSLTKTLVVMLVLSFAAVVYASPINCSLTPSAPACAPTLTTTIQVGSGPAQTISTAGNAVFSSGSWNVELASQSVQGFAFTGEVQTNSDPFVGFSIGAVNNTGHLVTVNFDYSTPYTGGPYAFAQAVYGDVLIDTNFSGQSTMHPVGTTGYIMNTYDTGHLISALEIGKGCTTPLHVFVCSSPDIGSIGPLHYTSLANGTLEVKGAFTLTPGAQYSITGRSALLPVPEPGTLVLLGSGLIGLAGFARRRMSN